MFKRFKIWLPVLGVTLLCGNVYSQPVEEKVEVRFNQNGYTIESAVEENEQSMQTINALAQRVKDDPSLSIVSVTIDSYASPEGDSYFNKKLSVRRSESLHSYMRDDLSIADSLITVHSRGVAWDRLREMVVESEMPNRDEVVEIIDNVPEEKWRRLKPTDRWQSLVDSRNKHLMDLRGGRPYGYMEQHFFPKMRSGSIVTICFKSVAKPVVETEVEVEPKVVKQAAVPTLTPEPIIEPTAEPVVSEVVETPAAEPAVAAEPAKEEDKDRKPIKIAVKSNLLYDLLMTPNIEVEVPIKDRWSVAGEWICPWWTTKSNGYALQLLAGQVEGRYWFGDRAEKPQLTGWFAGLYAGGGYFDMQWKDNGYQGEFYIAAGVAGGYAHTINKKGNLRLEYSLGLGYLSTDYSFYKGMQNNEYLVWQHDGRYRWVGPTKLEVSLVWFIDWQRGGKR